MGDTISDGGKTARPTLRQVLVAQYDALAGKLSRRIGPDLADDALHDAWLRLDKDPDPAAVRDPFAYVLKVALNLAADRRIRAKRQADLLGGEPTDPSWNNVPDDSPGPAEIAESREDLEAVLEAIASLPERRQEIMLAVFTQNVTHRQLAARYGVTMRTIQIEVQKGLAHIAGLTGRS